MCSPSFLLQSGGLIWGKGKSDERPRIKMKKVQTKDVIEREDVNWYNLSKGQLGHMYQNVKCVVLFDPAPPLLEFSPRR